MAGGVLMSEQTANSEQKRVNRVDGRQISFRVDDATYQKLRTSADVLNMTVASYAKSKAVNSRVVKPKMKTEEAIKIIRELNSIGNNLNQIARGVNTLLGEKESLELASKVEFERWKIGVEIEKLNERCDLILRQLN